MEFLKLIFYSSCKDAWYLSSPKSKKQFREFRDVFLRIFPNHKVYSVDGIDIKWDLWNEYLIFSRF